MLTFTNSSKRQAFRVYNPIPVTYEIVNPEDKTVKSKTVMSKDISTGGISFETDQTIPLDSRIKISFKLPSTANTIQATVRVVKVESTEFQNLYNLGTSFDTIADTDRDEIARFIERLSIHKLLELTIEKNASDLHLLVDHPPVLRIHGKVELTDWPKFSADEVQKIIYSILSKQQIKKFETDKELDFGLQYDIVHRFRFNLYQQRGFMEATLRLINTKIPTMEDLTLPAVVSDFARLQEGLILITGPTGSGKTTTIAAMIELINQEKKVVVITLERPIEYVYMEKKSIIKQREIGIDTNSFSIALKSSLRQDPNIIVIGELDDIETIRTAMIAAEAGYLVLASFHAPNTMQAIDRFAGMFPSENRKSVLSQLANCLKGIVSQILLPRRDQTTRLLACEIVIVNDAVKKIIRNDELVQLPNIIQTGASYKMQPMSESIKRYLDLDIVDPEIASFYIKEFLKYGR